MHVTREAIDQWKKDPLNLQRFSSQLRSMSAINHRPFVCAGDPFNCKIFIVGANPATPMKQSFFHYWDEVSGFDKAAWFADYKRERAEAPLKPGKSRRMAVSATRRVLDWVSEGADPAPCLETNIWSIQKPSIADLVQADQATEVFEYLLKTLIPRVILLHGKDARIGVSRIIGIDLDEAVTTQVTLYGVEAQIHTVSHLSRGWSKDRAKELGRYLRELLQDR